MFIKSLNFPFLFKKKGVDQINSDMRLAEEALKSMDLLCGIFPKFWKKSGGFKEDDAIWGDQKVRAMHFYILQLFVSIHSLAKNKITLLDTYGFFPIPIHFQYIL